jgi:hypothetical protein
MVWVLVYVRACVRSACLGLAYATTRVCLRASVCLCLFVCQSVRVCVCARLYKRSRHREYRFTCPSCGRRAA